MGPSLSLSLPLSLFLSFLPLISFCRHRGGLTVMVMGEREGERLPAFLGDDGMGVGSRHPPHVGWHLKTGRAVGFQMELCHEWRGGWSASADGKGGRQAACLGSDIRPAGRRRLQGGRGAILNLMSVCGWVGGLCVTVTQTLSGGRWPRVAWAEAAAAYGREIPLSRTSLCAHVVRREGEKCFFMNGIRVTSCMRAYYILIAVLGGHGGPAARGRGGREGD